MQCSNTLCRANVDTCLNYCHICSTVVPRRSTPCRQGVPQHFSGSVSGSVRVVSTVDQILTNQQTPSGIGTSSTIPKRRRILSEDVKISVGIVTCQSHGGISRRQNSARIVTIERTGTIEGLIVKAKQLMMLPQQLDGVGFNDFLMNDFRDLPSLAIQPSTTLEECMEMTGLAFSKMKFYFRLENSEHGIPSSRRRAATCTNTSENAGVLTENTTVTSLTEAINTDRLDSEVSNDKETADLNLNVTTVESIIKKWQSETRIDEVIRIIVNRANLKDTLDDNLGRTSFAFCKVPKICFMGEDALDGGGPRREFLTLLLRYIAQDSGLFHSNGDAGFFSTNVSFLEQHKYFDAGRVTAWSLLHGGPGLHYLATECVALLRGEKPQLRAWADFISDDSLKECAIKLSQSTDGTWESTLLEILPVLENSGFPEACRWQFHEKEARLNSFLLYVFYYRNTQAFFDFKNGLNSIGNLWNRLQDYPEIQVQLLAYQETRLTAEEFEKLLRFEYSEAGSNNFNAEIQTSYAFRMFLIRLEEDEPSEDSLTLSDLLMALTGSARIPPLGFSDKIKINWFNRMQGEVRYPRISTCDLSIELPRGFDNASDFYSYMKFAMKGSYNYFGLL